MSEVIHLAKELMACPSVTPNDAGCQQIISERLSKLGFHIDSMPFGDVENIWARYGKTSPLLTFLGHTDVVPTGPEADWESNPFNPEVRDGFLYGRGACDMKGGIAAMVIAVEHFIHAHPIFNGSIAFLITSDEEGPSKDGTKKVIEVLERRNEKIDFCIVGEPSSIHQVGDQVRVGRRGSLHGKLTIHGLQGHVAHPHLAKNPIHMGLLALNELVTTKWDNGNENFPPTTFQISNIHSGTGAANVIPGHVEITFNFRFSTAVTVQELQQRVEEILHKHELNFHIKWDVSAEPFLTRKAKLIAATQQAIKEICKQDVALSTGGGTSDGRFVAPTGAEIVELGPSHATAHHVNEHVRADDLEILVKLYVRMMEILLL